MKQQPQGDTFNAYDVVAYDIETIVADEMPDGSFPPWPRHQPVAAAFLSARWHPQGYDFDLTTLICRPGDEPAFYQKVNGILALGVTGVTYNGRGFDNRVLAIQAMRHAPAGDLAGLARQTLAGRFDGSHCDLADHLGGLGGARPVALAEICHALAIPIKTSVSGGDVAALWRAGEQRAVCEYVAEDVLATYLLWLHFIAFARSDETLISLPLAQLAGWIEMEPGLRHLIAFASCRAARLARGRAPALRVAAALRNAGQRVAHERDQAAFAAGRAMRF